MMIFVFPWMIISFESALSSINRNVFPPPDQNNLHLLDSQYLFDYVIYKLTLISVEKCAFQNMTYFVCVAILIQVKVIRAFIIVHGRKRSGFLCYPSSVKTTTLVTGRR